MLQKTFKILLLLCLTLNLYANNEENYSLKIELEKSNIFIGESILCKLTFTYNDLEDYKLPEIESSKFTLKEISSEDYKLNDIQSVEEIHYKLTPTELGKIEFGNFKVDIETINGKYKNFNNRSKYTKKFSIFSNTIDVNVKALPDNLSAIGDYVLDASIDKINPNVGEPVKLTVVLRGEGNVDNLDSLALDIKNATTYLLYSTKNSQKHEFTKTFEIVSNSDYIIPSFTMKYFNITRNKVETIRSRTFNIKLLNLPSRKTDKTKNNPDKKMNNIGRIIYFFYGVTSVLLLIFIYKIYKYFKKNFQESSFLNKVKNSKKRDSLYKNIVIYLGKDAELDKLIYMLENKDKDSFKAIKKGVLSRLQELGY